MTEAIRLEGIYKSFGEKKVFSGLNMEIKLGGVTLVTGPSGCGKTTLLRLIGGLETADRGTIHGAKDLKKSFVFQEDRLLEWRTALENASIGASKEAAAQALSSLYMDEALDQYPRQLSGGMKRRVALARALAYNGDLLLLDEPFVGLDDGLKQKAAALIARYCQKKTALIISHDPQDAQHLQAKTNILTLKANILC